MNFIEYHETIEKNLPYLRLSTKYDSSNQDKTYVARNLSDFRRAVNNIEEIPYISDEINTIKNSEIFRRLQDEVRLTSSEDTQLNNASSSLVIKLRTFMEIAEQSKLFRSVATLYIKIPEVGSFDDYLNMQMI